MARSGGNTATDYWHSGKLAFLTTAISGYFMLSVCSLACTSLSSPLPVSKMAANKSSRKYDVMMAWQTLTTPIVVKCRTPNPNR